jgi:hypothetical protein
MSCVAMPTVFISKAVVQCHAVIAVEAVSSKESCSRHIVAAEYIF